MRKFALLPSACAVFLLAALSQPQQAQAQQVDVAVGGSILLSAKNPNASQAYLPPPEKGGIYPSVSVDRIFRNHYGISGEFTYRYKQGVYNGYQGYRPMFFDLNGMYAARLSGRATAEVMGGVGGARVLFYSPGNCDFAAGCSTALNSNHFLVDLGVDVRYRLWRHYFVRPEARLYHIVNNVEFHSDNVLRVGASIGYTFGPK